MINTPISDPLPRIGSRVVLRRLTRDDLSSFQAYRHDEAVGRYQGWTPWPDDEAIAFLDKMSSTPLFPPGEWVQLGIAERQTNILIGDVGLCLACNAEAEIGFTLRAQSHGLGFATEAVMEAIQLLFEHTEATSVMGITDARNTASIRLLERVGMHKVASASATIRGEACIEHTYAIARK